ncbi:mechanosensitive ion channel family protein [Streptomyces sp. PTM05]|uniref:Mechanosensitive ion channel family protein n=2 Tax=Streptantibioticus parmotrematis TaxID=2873249 RepID=A0ABS7QTL2_9ACTN|nr:mechanosensitive ion channel family protein [Streptantibioticus parmotrematis]
MIAAASPDPGDPGQVTLDHAQQSANNAANYVQVHWANWVEAALRIILILAIAIVLRAMVRRMITQLISRMNRTAESRASAALGGLLVNAERRRQRSEAIGSVLRSVASFLILGTAALTVLSVLQINLAPLLASAGVAGVAVGFGARNLVTDFLSGVFMILEDQYGVGDTIDAGVASGTVIEVGLRVTKLRGDNGEIWYVRNGEVKRIGNLSQGWATAMVDIQVGYGEDLDRAREVITSAAEQMAKEEPWDEALWEPVQVLGLETVSADSVVIRAQAKTMPGKATGVARELRWRIKRAFDAEGITIAGGSATASDATSTDPAQAPLVETSPASAAAVSAPVAPAAPASETTGSTAIPHPSTPPDASRPPQASQAPDASSTSGASSASSSSGASGKQAEDSEGAEGDEKRPGRHSLFRRR